MGRAVVDVSADTCDRLVADCAAVGVAARACAVLPLRLVTDAAGDGARTERDEGVTERCATDRESTLRVRAEGSGAGDCDRSALPLAKLQQMQQVQQLQVLPCRTGGAGRGRALWAGRPRPL